MSKEGIEVIEQILLSGHRSSTCACLYIPAIVCVWATGHSRARVAVRWYVLAAGALSCCVTRDSV